MGELAGGRPVFLKVMGRIQLMMWSQHVWMDGLGPWGELRR